jgi:hypothetical protein
MRSDLDPKTSPSTLRLRLGQWLEISGAGWGVAAIPLVLLILALLAAARLTG